MGTQYDGGEAFKVDYQKAIQNLTDILIDNDKFQEMCKNIFDAIDTDNVGTLEVSQVEQFVRSFLRGNQVPGQINTSFEDSHNQIFKILKDNESGEITQDELGKFLNELLKNQVKMLQIKLEQQKYERSMAAQEKRGMDDETPAE
uniref:EF-hand domain-containing protein n=1 Tax=Strombidium rassoulzadegani TaxID=1082188 RepID=A0A7S3CMG8_9SPIT|mmetsp:Transcript_16763/g.28474  ORF Transcript_16763/g.28474 Transcript_16763/m.28474 type:complete len:145 (+) Transcript_16763:136-570(+)